MSHLILCVQDTRCVLGIEPQTSPVPINGFLSALWNIALENIDGNNNIQNNFLKKMFFCSFEVVFGFSGKELMR